MNKKSELHKLLKYKPLINPNTNDVFFDVDVESDLKLLKENCITKSGNSHKNIWTWTIEDSKNRISFGYWRVNRNLYIITTESMNPPNVLPEDKTFQLLPRDFDTLNAYCNQESSIALSVNHLLKNQKEVA